MATARRDVGGRTFGRAEDGGCWVAVAHRPRTGVVAQQLHEEQRQRRNPSERILALNGPKATASSHQRPGRQRAFRSEGYKAFLRLYAIILEKRELDRRIADAGGLSQRAGAGGLCPLFLRRTAGWSTSMNSSLPATRRLGGHCAGRLNRWRNRAVMREFGGMNSAATDGREQAPRPAAARLPTTLVVDTRRHSRG